MIIKKTLLRKVLTGGFSAEFKLVKDNGQFQIALFVNNRLVGGATTPQPLTVPKGDITHWMGNKPSVGLTTREAEELIYTLQDEIRMQRTT